MMKKSDDRKLQEKLSKLFGRLGSANKHESEVARAMIDKLLAASGKTWNDLTELLQTGKGEETWRDPDDARADRAAPPADDNAAGPPVNPFDLVYYTLEKYLSVKRHELVAITLWAMHTLVFDRFAITPRLALLSPVRGCGKSTVIDILARVTRAPQKLDHVTPANLYRLIDRMCPTLLLDEVDNLELMNSGPLRAVLNSGHKRGGYIGRVDGGVSRQFSTFAPVAFGAIGTLPLPLMHRCIVINMSRAPRHAVLERFDPNNVEQIEVFNAIYGQLYQWSQCCQLDTNPAMPAQLHNRRADNWRVLLAIADACNHGRAAREAAIALSLGHQDEDPAVELLGDIRTIFYARKVDRLASADIISDLVDPADSPWSEWRGTRSNERPHKLRQPELAGLLRPFGIRPRSIWPAGPRAGARSRKGYLRSQFEAAWASYCDAGTPSQGGSIKTLQSP